MFCIGLLRNNVRWRQVSRLLGLILLDDRLRRPLRYVLKVDGLHLVHGDLHNSRSLVFLPLFWRFLLFDSFGALAHDLIHQLVVHFLLVKVVSNAAHHGRKTGQVQARQEVFHRHLVFSDIREEFLRVRAGLSAGSRLDVLFNLFPIFTEPFQSLKEPNVLVSAPPAVFGFPVALSVLLDARDVLSLSLFAVVVL